MNIIISLVYAPLVFLSLRYFDVRIVSIILLISSLLWFFINIKKSFKESLYPLLYILLAICTYTFNEFLILKAVPLIISFIFTTLILISYLNKKSIILYFAKKFSKKEIPKKEEEYIHKSTLFWFIISCTNVILHLMIFYDENIELWVYYSSFGWYFIFIFAAVLQFLHRNYILKKVLND